MSSFEDMGADPDHPEEFTESGVWMELNDNSGGMDVGTFNDFRNIPRSFSSTQWKGRSL